MNTYNRVKQILKIYPECRDSDKKLLWRYWQNEFYSSKPNILFYNDFLKCTSAESITRARRAIQKHHPELQASEPIKKARSKKASNPKGWLY